MTTLYGIYDENGNAMGEGFQSFEEACRAAQFKANRDGEPRWVDRMDASEQGNPTQINPEKTNAD